MRMILTQYAMRGNRIDRGLVLLWFSRPFVSLFIYKITTPWTKGIREKEKIVFRFFYRLKEDKMTEGTFSGPRRIVRQCESRDCPCKQDEDYTCNFACRWPLDLVITVNTLLTSSLGDYWSSWLIFFLRWLGLCLTRLFICFKRFILYFYKHVLLHFVPMHSV